MSEFEAAKSVKYGLTNAAGTQGIVVLLQLGPVEQEADAGIQGYQFFGTVKAQAGSCLIYSQRGLKILFTQQAEFPMHGGASSLRAAGGRLVKTGQEVAFAGQNDFVGALVQHALGFVEQVAGLQQGRSFCLGQEGIFHGLRLPGNNAAHPFNQLVSAGVKQGKRVRPIDVAPGSAKFVDTYDIVRHSNSRPRV